MSSDSPSRGHAQQRILLAVLALDAFCFGSSAMAMAPLLVDVAGQYHVSVGNAGLAAAVYSLPGMLFGIVVGPLVDRNGCKRFLVGGTLLLGVGSVLSAAAPSFGVLVLARLLAGAGFALAAPSMQASIPEHFSHETRGRAVATLVGAVSVSSIISVPLSGLVADAMSWRASFGVLTALAFLAFAVTVVWLPRSSRSGVAVGGLRLYRRIGGHRPALALLGAGLLGTIGWVIWEAYLVVFFQATFGVSQSLAATAALTSGLGALIGSQAGVRLVDQIGHLRVLSAALAISGGLVLAMAVVPVGLVVSALLNMALMMSFGTRNVSLIALLGGLLPEARATLMSIWTSLVAGAGLVGTTVGGMLLDAVGFWLIGVFSCALFAAALTVLRMYPSRAPEGVVST